MIICLAVTCESVPYTTCLSYNDRFLTNFNFASFTVLVVYRSCWFLWKICLSWLQVFCRWVKWWMLPVSFYKQQILVLIVLWYVDGISVLNRICPAEAAVCTVGEKRDWTHDLKTWDLIEPSKIPLGQVWQAAGEQRIVINRQRNRQTSFSSSFSNKFLDH